MGESNAAITDRLIESVDVLEAAVGEHLVDERPKVLGGLQFGAMCGLKDEADAFGDGQIFRTVPASVCRVEG
jgi:hypothetical protein